MSGWEIYKSTDANLFAVCAAAIVPLKTYEADDVVFTVLASSKARARVQPVLAGANVATSFQLDGVVTYRALPGLERGDQLCVNDPLAQAARSVWAPKRTGLTISDTSAQLTSTALTIRPLQ